jgi:hypothetical protein
MWMLIWNGAPPTMMNLFCCAVLLLVVVLVLVVVVVIIMIMIMVVVVVCGCGCYGQSAAVIVAFIAFFLLHVHVLLSSQRASPLQRHPSAALLRIYSCAFSFSLAS